MIKSVQNLSLFFREKLSYLWGSLQRSLLAQQQGDHDEDEQTEVLEPVVQGDTGHFDV